MKPKSWRFVNLVMALIGLAAATALVLSALSDNISYYRTPSDVLAGKVTAGIKGRNFRLGGLVEPGSLVRMADGKTITFNVTDESGAKIAVMFEGATPDLFREGQGVIAEGRIRKSGQFVAHRLLAKHDENYKPPTIQPTP